MNSSEVISPNTSRKSLLTKAMCFLNFKFIEYDPIGYSKRYYYVYFNIIEIEVTVFVISNT
jgi:hypothetical protein